MPLLGKKLFVLAKPLTSVNPSETIYVIKHTGEQFRSKDHYLARKQHYEEDVWTCRCSGRTGLTHQEAWESEQSVHKMLENFPQHFEKPVLEVVHHSTLNLELLVDQANEKLGCNLFPGDVVQLKVEQGGLVISGSVVNLSSGIYKNKLQKSVHEKENFNIGGFSANQELPKKTQPKFLPYFYTIKLENDNKIISGVPAADLIRKDRPPTNDMIKLFIRARAMRFGSHPNSPWVVDKDYVKKFNLPSKFAEFLISPDKMKEAGKFPEAKKRSSAPSNMDNLDAKRNKTAEKRNSKTPTHKITKLQHKEEVSTSLQDKTISKEGSVSMPLIEIDLCSSSPSKETKHSVNKDDSKCFPVTKQLIITTSVGKSFKKLDTPMQSHIGDVKKEKNIGKKKLEKKTRKKTTSSKSSPKKVISTKVKHVKDNFMKNTGGKTSQKQNGFRKSPKTSHLTTPNKQTYSKKSSPKKETPTKVKLLKDSPKKSKQNKNHSASNDVSPKRKLKQMTLLDMSLKRTPTASSSRNPEKEVLVLPNFVKALAALVYRKDTLTDTEKKQMKMWTLRAAKELHPKYIAVLTPEMRDLISNKKTQLEDAKKFKTMTVEERKEYNVNKKRERHLQKNAIKREEKKRFEDSDLKDLVPLPVPKLVSTPEGLPNELFGDVLMICEFINSYRGLLLTGEKTPVDPGLLMNALVSAGEGYVYLSWILSIFLHALLQDQSTQKLTELGVPLAHLVVNKFTSPEILRLILRSESKGISHDDSDLSDYYENCEVPEQLVDKLETSELFELEPQEKLKLVVCLCHKLMSSDAVQNYMDAQAKFFTQTCVEKAKVEKQLNEEKKKELDRIKKESENKLKENLSQTKMKDETGATLADMDASPDMVSIVKRRRSITKEETEKNKQEEKEKRMKIEDGLLLLKQKEQLDKQLEDVRRQMLETQRLGPLGTDRNHNRYWLFQGAAPVLCIERGWVDPSISYNVQTTKKADVDDDEIMITDSDDEIIIKSLQSSPSQRSTEIVPAIGQNLWFCYETVEEIEELVKTLHPHGIRESVLLEKLQKCLPQIKNGFSWREKNKTPELTPSSGEELVEQFKKELTEVEIKTGQGAIGGVPSFEKWEKKLVASKTYHDLGQRLLETDQAVYGQFFSMNFSSQKSKVKIDDSSENDEEVPSKMRAKWQEAVECATTMSRLHVLLAILDSSILWEKSAENAKCRICRRKGDEAKLLLCDECNLAFHVHCLRPPLSNIPRGEWYCTGCRKPEEHESSRRRRLDYAESEDSDDEDESDNESDNSSYESEVSEIEHDSSCKVCKKRDDDLVECGSCPNSFHMECHKPSLRYPPRGNWYCMHCTKKKRNPRAPATGTKRNKTSNSKKEEESSDESVWESESEIEHDSSCKVCKKRDDDLVECGSCPNSFHMECHKPSLRYPPRGSWNCMHCTKKKGMSTTGKGSMKNKRSNSRKGKRSRRY